MIENDLLNLIEHPDEQLAADAQAGDVLAEEALIRKYTSVVMGKAKAYFMAGADENDVIQEGMIGLLKAVRGFEKGKNASFSTFAETCVTNQIISAIRSASRIKHKPLNTSVPFNVPVNANEPKMDGVTLEDVIEDMKVSTPEDVLIIKDVTRYILNNGDNIFSEFEMQVLTELTKGYNTPIIAGRLGKNDKSIDNAIQRIKRKVMAYLWE